MNTHNISIPFITLCSCWKWW